MMIKRHWILSKAWVLNVKQDEEEIIVKSEGSKTRCHHEINCGESRVLVSECLLHWLH